jgi:hypothetical protein
MDKDGIVGLVVGMVMGIIILMMGLNWGERNCEMYRKGAEVMKKGAQ